MQHLILAILSQLDYIDNRERIELADYATSDEILHYVAQKEIADQVVRFPHIINRLLHQTDFDLARIFIAYVCTNMQYDISGSVDLFIQLAKPDQVKLLLTYTPIKRTYLELAIVCDSYDTVKYLVESGTNLSEPINSNYMWNSFDQYYHTPITVLQLACCQNFLSTINVVQLLLDYGADIHANDEHALKIAVYHNNYKLSKFLLDNGAKCGTNGLHVVNILKWITVDPYRLIKLLLEYNVCETDDISDAIATAVVRGFYNTCHLLLSYGICLSEIKYKNICSLACFYERVRLLKLLLEYGPTTDITEWCSIYSVMCGASECLSVLLAYDPGLINHIQYYYTDFSTIMKYNKASLCEVLIPYYDITSEHLQDSIIHNNPRIVKLILTRMIITTVMMEVQVHQAEIIVLLDAHSVPFTYV